MNASEGIVSVMSISEWISAISLIIAGLSALYARHAWTSARHAILQQTLQTLHAEYASAEMLDAVDSLWKFYKRHGDANLAAEYEKQRIVDEKELTTKHGSDRIEFIKTSLHYKRRIVSHFYMHVHHLLNNKIISKEAFYAGWSKADLEIIVKIIVPLEQHLGKTLKTGASADRLKLLYDKAK